ncbi:MAG: dockerin type I repeat-containing protein, partial [candidate division Zixibacteria bacterium]|nr:dockerin type I repeat-containing protein [candidate division Zixibacteria bacterium]
TPTYCADESFTSSARYVNDSLRIEYLEDLDAGSFVSNESGTKELLNPIKFISYPCIDMAPYRVLSSTPSAIKYPFHAVTNVTATQDLFLQNGGNLAISWTSSLLGGGCPIVLAPTFGSVPAGCPNSATVVATAGPLGTEGLFKNTIRFTYDSPAKTLDIPVDFYVFDSWFLEQDVSLRTAHNRLLVNQTAQAANSNLGTAFTYFDDLTENFITDASLIMGNSAQNLSWRIYKSGQGDPGSTDNNFGWLYALTNTDADSTSYYPGPNGYGYRIASGSGTNRDTTVGFDVSWYAASHVDSADFYVAHFDVYKGLKATGDVNGLSIAFAADWDVPSDSSSSNNSVHLDAARQMIYLQGTGTGKPGTTYIPRTQGFGGTAAYREDGVPIAGGFAFGNKEQVYPNRGLQVDSVWKYMDLTSGYTSRRDTTTDQTIVMVVAKGYTLTSTHLKFDVVLLGKRAQDNPTGLAGLNSQAQAFIKNYIWPSMPSDPVLCPSCNSCGDANDDGGIDISDAVFLISYIFSGGAAPHDCNGPNGKGDANGDGGIDISDAVYLISYIFSGGAAPHCP